MLIKSLLIPFTRTYAVLERVSGASLTRLLHGLAVVLQM